MASERGHSNIRAVLDEAARSTGVPLDLITSVIYAESTGNPNAYSDQGAGGLMQLMPDTARLYGVKNVNDPRENVIAGSKYLRDLKNQYGDWGKALMAYNGGPGAVAYFDRHHTLRGYGKDNETYNYVKKIFDMMMRHGQR